MFHRSQGEGGSPPDNGGVIHWYETCSMASTETCSTVTGPFKNRKRNKKRSSGVGRQHGTDNNPFYSFYEQQDSMFAPTSTVICQSSSHNRSNKYHRKGGQLDEEYAIPIYQAHQGHVALRVTMHNDGTNSDSGGFTAKDSNIGKVRGKVKSLLCSSGPYRKKPRSPPCSVVLGKRHHSSSSTPFILIDTKPSEGSRKKKRAGRGKYEFEDEEEAQVWIIQPRLLPQEMPSDMIIGEIEPLPMSISTYTEAEEELSVLQELML